MCECVDVRMCGCEFKREKKATLKRVVFFILITI